MKKLTKRIAKIPNKHSWTPPPPLPPLIKRGGGEDLPKIESLGEGMKIFARKGG